MTPEDREIFARIAEGMDRTRPKFLGMTLKDIVILGSLFISVVGFYIRTDDAINRLIKSTEYFSIYAQNSDSFHSATTGTQFYQGKPVNPNFDASIYKGEHFKPEGNVKGGFNG